MSQSYSCTRLGRDNGRTPAIERYLDLNLTGFRLANLDAIVAQASLIDTDISFAEE